MKKPRVIGAIEPPIADDADCAALRALADGVATAGQQKAALAWIVNRAALTYDMPYRPGGEDGDRDTAFACGRMFVGQQIVRAMKTVKQEKA